MGAAYLGISEGSCGWAEGSVGAGGEGVEAVGGGVGACEGHAFEFVAGAPGVGEEDRAGFGVVGADEEACGGGNIREKSRLL